jgi:hypothetical protein
VAMDYDTSLVAGADIVNLTGVQDLANLATDAELVLNTLALSAHRAIYRKLEARGIDPTLLTNESRLKDAVAYEAVGRFALAGYLGTTDAQAMLALADKASGVEFRPVYASADTPANASSGIPAVGHLDDDNTGVFYDDTPTVS